MTRERFEQILFAHVSDEVAQDMLNEYVLELESNNAKLRELVREIWKSCPVSEDDCAKCSHRIEEDDEVWCDIPILMEQLGVLGVEVTT